MKYDYQWQELQNSLQHDYIPDIKFGYKVLERDSSGKAISTKFSIYTPSLGDKKIYVIGDFNSWGKTNIANFELRESKGDKKFRSIVLGSEIIKHKDSYVFFCKGKYLRDPQTRFFDDVGNSVFWDFEDPSVYKFKHDFKKEVYKAQTILQTDLQGLVTHFKNKDAVSAAAIDFSDYYNFIATSGVIKKIKDLGFNCIQFLPVSQSIDGDKWSYRYLTPFLSAINKKWGNPDDFRKMVDMFHKNGISLILDLVVSHFPNKDYKLVSHSSKKIGLHLWDEIQDKVVYQGSETFWGTARYNLDDKYIRKMLIETAINYLKDYKIDGFRIDNVDGIIRFGKNGDEEERVNGRKFLQEFNTEVYKLDKDTLIYFESHYYVGENAKLLVAPLNSHKSALGATTYNDSRLTYFLHKDFMPKSADDISPWKINEIIDDKRYSKSRSTVTDFHNHDAAAGLMDGRATGSYAFDALTLGNKKLNTHAIGKIKVMESIISLCFEGRTLDLLQTHILQKGTFEHDNTIHWDLLNKKINNSVLNFKSDINKLILSEEEFWPLYSENTKIINIDDINKIFVVFKGKDKSMKSGFLVIINMSAFEPREYLIPIPAKNICKVVINSNEKNYGALSNSTLEGNLTPIKTSRFEYYKYAVQIPKMEKYMTLVLKY